MKQSIYRLFSKVVLLFSLALILGLAGCNNACQSWSNQIHGEDAVHRKVHRENANKKHFQKRSHHKDW
jgi:hypothetical protein